VFDTSLYIYICVKHFGMANIKFGNLKKPVATMVIFFQISDTN